MATLNCHEEGAFGAASVQGAKKLLVASLLPVVRPGASSNILVPRSLLRQ